MGPSAWIIKSRWEETEKTLLVGKELNEVIPEIDLEKSRTVDLIKVKLWQEQFIILSAFQFSCGHNTSIYQTLRIPGSSTCGLKYRLWLNKIKNWNANSVGIQTLLKCDRNPDSGFAVSLSCFQREVARQLVGVTWWIFSGWHFTQWVGVEKQRAHALEDWRKLREGKKYSQLPI